LRRLSQESSYNSEAIDEDETTEFQQKASEARQRASIAMSNTM
jgi:hypothetical protein